MNVRPKICLCLTEKTIAEDLKVLDKYRRWIDIVELRVDYLTDDERLYVRNFPEQARIPCILTIRRRIDGGLYEEGEATRTTLFARALAFADQDVRKNFAYIDLESDYKVPSLQDASLAFGTCVIRSFYDTDFPQSNICNKLKEMRITGYEIPKITVCPKNLSELTMLFRQAKEPIDFEHIICASGPFSTPERILANKLGSSIVYTYSQEFIKANPNLGLVDPVSINEIYNFRLLDENTQVFGITGYPLEITDSPIIHNEGYRKHGMNSVYVPVKAEKIEEALEFADEIGIKGLSVSHPFKERIMPNLSQVSSEVGDIGACNTAVKYDDEWVGYNTDARGLHQALIEFLGVRNLSFRRVAIIGAGGAARAVAYVIKQLRGKACIFNRTVVKAKRLADQFGFKYAALEPESYKLLENYSDIIIQTTSAGMNVTENSKQKSLSETFYYGIDYTAETITTPDIDPLYFYKFRGDEEVYDLIYTSERTPLLQRAEEAGCRVENGSSMLKYQAYHQFELFTGEKY